MKTFMRIFQRLVVLALLIALGTWLFYIGREHQIFLDNKSIERDGKNFKALEQVNVSINGGEPIELLARDRDVIVFVGPKAKVKVEVFDSMGGDVEREVSIDLELGFDKDIMLNIPLLAALRTDFILPPPGGIPAPQDDAPAASEGPVISE